MRNQRRIDPAFLVVLLAVVARLLPGPRIVDDAYITFRYARNLLAGYGLVYNPGEMVFGASTPAYVLLLAGVGVLTGGKSAPFPLISWILNALLDGIACWFLIKLGEELGHRRAGLAASLVWAIAPWSVSFSIGGMETSFLIALMAATLYFFIAGRHQAAALSGSLAFLTRPDALIFLGPLVIERLRQSLPLGHLHRKRIPLQAGEIAFFLAPPALWGAFAFMAYGTPLPHSISAKVVAYNLAPLSALVRLLQHYATPFLGHETFGLWWIGLGMILYPFLYLLGSRSILDGHPEAWAFLLYPWLYLLTFALFNPLIFRWYLTPPLPVLFLGIFLGAEKIGKDLRWPILLPLVAAAAFIMTSRAWTMHPDHGPDRPAPEMAYIQLELLYQRVADDLGDQIEPGQVLAAGDIGALGYFTNARILDTVGLISPRSVGYYPLPKSYYAINYAVSPELIHDFFPDYLVILEVYGRQSLLKDRRFRETYQLMEKIPTDIYASEGMLVFRRID